MIPILLCHRIRSIPVSFITKSCPSTFLFTQCFVLHDAQQAVMQTLLHSFPSKGLFLSVASSVLPTGSWTLDKVIHPVVIHTRIYYGIIKWCFTYKKTHKQSTSHNQQQPQQSLGSKVRELTLLPAKTNMVISRLAAKWVFGSWEMNQKYTWSRSNSRVHKSLGENLGTFCPYRA